jgi:hypothetical protein
MIATASTTPSRYRRPLARLIPLAGIIAMAAGTALAAQQPSSTSSSAAAKPAAPAHHADVPAQAPVHATPASFEDVLREQDPSDAWLSLALTGAGMLGVAWARSRVR